MLSKFLLRSIACLLCACTVQAQMTPSAPVQNFRLPRFGDNGYTQWVLQGGKGIYDSAEQIRIEDMALRVYSGDERMALEMTMDSPEATLLTQENRAESDGPIKIVGANFKVSGVGWTWDGATKEIEVKFDVVVEFTQGMEGVFTVAGHSEGGSEDDLQSSASAGASGAEMTEIHSHSLLLQTTPEAYRFEFTDSVHAVSGEMDLKSEVLIAIADAPKGKSASDSTVAGGKLDSIHQLIATDQVVIHRANHVLKAGRAEFLLREDTAHFSGLPQIETEGAYLSGETIQSQAGKVVVTGGSEAGRAQMIVSQAGGLGIMGAEALSSETIVLSDVITMLELEGGSQFLFEGAVDVMSGAMQMRSDSLTLLADSVPEGEALVAEPASSATVTPEPVIQVGEVKQLIAEGSVWIEQEGRVATADRVTFYPQDERADLAGSPRIVRGDAVVVGDSMQLTPNLSIVEGSAELQANLGEVIVTGDRMELKPGVAVVQSTSSQRVKVVLPEMEDLGYGDLQSFTLAPGATSAEEPSSTAPKRKTVVQSKTLRMIESADNTLFRFTKTVSVNGTNLDAICGRLDVTAVPVAAAETSESPEVTSQMEVQLIEAFDNVVFKQTGRVATGDKATIQPVEGQVVLEGNAVVTDESGKVSGHRMTLLQGQRRAIVEGDRSTGQRATMTLPELKPKQ